MLIEVTSRTEATPNVLPNVRTAGPSQKERARAFKLFMNGGWRLGTNLSTNW